MADLPSCTMRIQCGNNTEFMRIKTMQEKGGFSPNLCGFIGRVLSGAPDGAHYVTCFSPIYNPPNTPLWKTNSVRAGWKSGSRFEIYQGFSRITLIESGRPIFVNFERIFSDMLQNPKSLENQ